MVRSNRYWFVVLFAAAAGTSVPLTGQAAPDSMLHFRNLRIVGCGASGCLPLTAAQLQRPANASVSTDPNALPVADSPARGAAHPKVTLVEFADYTCPFTIPMEPIVRKVVNEHADTVRLVIKHHWLPAHAHARLAAQVSVAADLQGKFWPVHEMLLDRHFASGKDGATIEGFVPYLRTIPGLDVARLVREVNSPEVNARVDRELKEFKSTATPEFVLNGRFFQGQVSEAQLELLIEEASH